MKTKEFLRRVEDELGYVTDRSENYITIRKEYGKLGKIFAMVAMNKVLGIDTSFHNFTSLDKHDRNLLFDLIRKYAETPIEEREEEKKYLVEIKTTDSTLHLWRATDGSGDTDFILKDRTTTGQRLFTKKEIESIDSRFLQFAQFAIEVTQ